MKGIYLDNAATSWPKPETVLKSMENYFSKIGGSAGRAGHWRAIEAGRIVLSARQALGEILNVQDESHLVFTKNGSEALNLAIQGTLEPGDHVITTSMEHNSVLRPLEAMKSRDISVSYINGNTEGKISPSDIEKAISEKTRLVIMTHASNITGTLNDIYAVSRICKEKSIQLLVDAAQSAGAVPLDIEELQADYVAMAGHKGLLGPQGTGALYIKDKELIRPIMWGGTGSLSDSEKMPEFMPDRFESGTLNIIGLAGLQAGCNYLKNRGIDNIRNHEMELHNIFLSEIVKCKRITIYGPLSSEEKTGVLSVNIEGMTSSEAGQILDEKFGICTRIGLHCAPRAHQTIGTSPGGTIRFSWGPFTRKRDLVRAAKALVKVAR